MPSQAATSLLESFRIVKAHHMQKGPYSYLTKMFNQWWQVSQMFLIWLELQDQAYFPSRVYMHNSDYPAA